MANGATSEAGKIISSELLMCVGGVRMILSLPLVATYMLRDNRCSIWHMFVFMSVVVTVWGSVGMCVV